jgi:hypothetical protein
MKTTSYSARNGKLLIGALVQEIGEDLLVSIWGGTRPHIGAVGMAVSRPSLADSRRWSATSSNFTFTGHKEDRLVKDISEAIAAGLRKNVVVTAGMHWDTLAPRDLVMVQALAQKLAHKICRGIARRSQHARSTR